MSAKTLFVGVPVSAAVLSAGLLLAPALSSAQSDPVRPEPAVEARLADESLLLDVTSHEDGYVAVGERGHVLLSPDGRQWRQAASVPVRATLTRVTNHGRRLWAAGHDATIISSMDGGETWFVQHFDPEGDDLEPEVQGPLLDIAFVNPNQGFAVGAYGRFMTTDDGGINWVVERIDDRVTSEAIDWQAFARQQGIADTLPEDQDVPGGDDPLAQLDRGCYDFQECHLNAILVLPDDRMMIAAERGYGYRSRDRGATWEAFRFPYTGSMFGLVAAGECIFAFGLRGHVQRSCDFGDSWDDLAVDSQQSLMGGDVRSSGEIVLVGAGATRLTITPDGVVDITSDRLGSDYAAVVAREDGLILVGENGVRNE